MRVLRLRTVALVGVLGVAGMGLVGVGAHAVFTTSTVSAQTVTAGTLDMTLFSRYPGVTGNDTPHIRFADLGPEASTFTTWDQLVTITNRSDIPVSDITATPGDSTDGSPASRAFANEVSLCEVSLDTVIYNGPLHLAPALAIDDALAAFGQPGHTLDYAFTIFAGPALTACGTGTPGTWPAPAGFSSAPPLNPDAEGGVINPSLTVSATG
jgi:hypothetical protein